MEPVLNPGALSSWTPGVFSIVIYAMAVLGLIAILLFLSSWLGEKNPTPTNFVPMKAVSFPPEPPG